MASKNFRKLKERLLGQTDLAQVLPAAFATSVADVQREVQSAQSQLFVLKMKKAVGELVDTAQLWKVRKEIARMKTLHSQQLKVFEKKGLVQA